MRLIGCMPVRNEGWILGLSARAALMWLDELVILEHSSTDETRSIITDLICEFPARVRVIVEDDPVWEEMRHRQRMLAETRDRQATHVAIVDADEILSGDLLAGIRGMIEATPKASILQLPWLCLRGSIARVHKTGIWGEQNVSVAFRDSPELHWSSEGRGGYDFHHRHPMGRTLSPWRPVNPFNRPSGLMHLQFVSGRRLRAKQALYKATEVLRWPDREPVDVVDRRYNLAVYGKEHAPTVDDGPFPALAECPESWWSPYRNLMQHFRPHAEPWQETELKRLIAQHGQKRFAGLDFFGISDDRRVRA